MAEPQYGSDLVVDVLQQYGIEYIALNPGSSFRGLHDSLVNYGNNVPRMVAVQHEKIAVELAHGYAKATGKPLAVVLHNVVGLLHAAMGIYCAYIDRVPILILGGTGPLAYERRRPNIDWIHTANVQGNAVRDFTKWDDQPASINSFPESIARAYRVAMSEPRGPVYVCLDAGLQEDRIDGEVPGFDPSRFQVPASPGPDPAQLERLARALVAAERPVIVTAFLGRDERTWDPLIELADLLGIGVVDRHFRLSFPNRHRLNVSGTTDAIREADCVLFLDVKDMSRNATRVTETQTSRTLESLIAPDATILDIGFNDFGISAWSQDSGRLHPVDIQVTADAVVALPLLLDACRALEAEQPEWRDERRERREAVGELHDANWAQWRATAAEVWDQSPVSTARLAAEVWEVIKDYDWVLTAGTASGWALKTWDFDRPYRHPGAQLGTATQIGISLGVALAHKGTGRLVVDLQPDGDLMYDAGALWVASYHRIPLLVVMFNNRAYYNDWAHQERVAHQRGRDPKMGYVGMEIDDPAPDFCTLARAFDWYAEGPIDDPNAVQDAVRHAATHVLDTGLPALVDVVCQPQ